MKWMINLNIITCCFNNLAAWVPYKFQKAIMPWIWMAINNLSSEGWKHKLTIRPQLLSIE